MFFCLRKKAGKRQRTESKYTNCNRFVKSYARKCAALKSGGRIAGMQRQSFMDCRAVFLSREGGEDRFSK